MSIITYPLDGKYYNAQDAETYLCTRTSGVFSQDISFTPNGMNITVSPFLAWIKNDDFSGKSVAVTTDTTLTISPSEPILSRIDRIVLRFDARKNGSELMVLKGTPSSSPAVPSIERTPVIYDLCLCQISVKPSATSISAGDITSTLLDESLCGIMRDGVTGIPTLQLQSQAQDLIRELEVAISMAENGSPVLQSLGIKRGMVDVTIGEKGQTIYESNDVTFDTVFLDEPKVIVTRRTHYLPDIVYKYIKPQEGVRAKGNGFSLEVFSEKDIPTTLTLRYNWIAIGRVAWDNDSGGGNGGGGDGGGDGGEEEDDTEYFTISTSVDPAGSGITEGAGNFAKGSTTKLVARAFSGYMFEGWYLGNSKVTSNAEYTVTVNSNATYTAKFIEAVPDIVVQINVEPAGTGTVSGAGTYEKGSTVNLGATPKDGYKFVGWYVGNTKYASTPDYSVTLNASTTFTAKFEEEVVTPDYYTVIAKVTPTGSGTVTGGGQYVPGATAKLKATANEGYVFSYWSSGTETINSAEFTFVVSSNRTWTAHFIEGEEETGKVTITTSVEPANTGTVTGGGEVNTGSMSAIQANANSGYKFKHWRFENGETDTENPYLFRASADRTFVAVFEVDSGGEETTYTSDTLVNGTLYVGTETTNIETDDGYAGRTDITQVIIPEGRTRIADNCFSNCSNLTSVTIPVSLTQIGSYAFDRVDKLTDIYYGGTKAQWNAIGIDGVFQTLYNLTVHCSDGNIEYCEVDFVFSPDEGTKTFDPHTQINTTSNTSCYLKNSIVILKSTPEDGYSFVRYERNDGVSSTNNPYNFTITQSMTVTVVTERTTTTTETAKLYIYSSNAGTGDVVKLTKDEAGTQPWNKNEFSEGETAYFFAQAGTGRTIERLVFKIDNATVADMTADEMVEEGILNSDKNKLSQQHYVAEGQTSEFVATVYFGVKQQSTHTVTTRVSPEGAGSTTGGGSYTNGSSATLSATAIDDYRFSYWEFDDGNISDDNPCYKTVNKDFTATAVFINVANGVTYKISSRNAGTGDTVGLYSEDDSTGNADLSKPLGTVTTLYAGDITVVSYYAKAGSNRKINSVEILIDGVSSGTMSGEDLNEYIVNGAFNLRAGWYDKNDEGKTYELVVYFGETVEKKTITFSSFYGTTKVVCNGVELSNSRDKFTHEFNTGDEITLTFIPDSGTTFDSWINDDTASRLSDDNPWTFTVDSSTVRKIGITYSQT